jgi:diguanylate cyclase (GGDEF)-like protein
MDDILKTVRPLSPRALTGYYLSALMLIAGLNIASHLVLTYVLHHNQGTAAVLNTSGRQRMLSQRIASLAAEYRLGDPTARPALIAAINDFEVKENALSATSVTATGDTSEMLQLRSLYFTGQAPLSVEVANYVADARAVASLPAGAPAASAPLARLFAAARGPLLTKLDDVVTVHQSETERVLAELERLQLGILATVLLTLGIEALTIFRPMIRRIAAYTSEILRLATTDPLTELANRRSFQARFEEERDRALRYGRPLSLLMIDIDRFKEINDAHGHDAGDASLRSMAESFRQVLRKTDFAARLGGEEFVILMPETDLSNAAKFAERLRETVAGLSIAFRKQQLNFTVSIGVTLVGGEGNSMTKALQDADRLMYRAKQNGRNCIVAG